MYSLIVIVMFFIISWRMTLFTFAVMVPGLLAAPLYGKFMKKIMKEISNARADASSVAEEAFSNIRTVKAFATEDTECVSYGEKNDNIYAKAKRAAHAYGIFNFFIQLVMYGSLDALVYFAAWLNSRD